MNTKIIEVTKAPGTIPIPKLIEPLALISPVVTPAIKEGIQIPKNIDLKKSFSFLTNSIKYGANKP